MMHARTAGGRQTPRIGKDTTATAEAAGTRTSLGLARPAATLTLGAVLLPGSIGAQETSSLLPFAPGEVLEYRLVSSRFGTVGSGRMRVDGPEDVRGTSTFVLSLDVGGGVAFLGFDDATRSWLDPASMASLRFRKEENHALGGHGEAVEIYPDEGRWVDEEGVEGLLMTNRPLDELSILYFLRTIDLDEISGMRTLLRHFDPVRNPVRVRVVGADRVSVPAGSFPALVVEMEVRDDRRYGEKRGIVRVHYTKDERRIPLRIESTAPWLGRVVLELERFYIPGGRGDSIAASPHTDGAGPGGARKPLLPDDTGEHR